MRKIASIMLIITILMFNITMPVFAANVFKEGVYSVADFNYSPENTYTVQNISDTDSVYVVIFDEDQLTVQSIRLNPNSAKYNLLPLQPDYRIIIVGNGEVFVS